MKKLCFVLALLLVFCACGKTQIEIPPEEPESIVPESSESSESEFFPEKEEEIPSDAAKIDEDLHEKLGKTRVSGLQFLNGNNIYLVSFDRRDMIEPSEETNGGFLMYLYEYDYSNGTAEKIYTGRGFFDHSHFYDAHFESSDSVSVIMRDIILEINKGEVENEVVFDDHFFKGGRYSLSSGVLACYCDEFPNSVVLHDFINEKTFPVYTSESSEELFKSLVISPDGEKIAFLADFEIVCCSSKGEILFRTECIDENAEIYGDYYIEWLSDEKILFISENENDNITLCHIYNMNGEIEKTVKLSFVVFSKQYDLAHSYPFGIFSSVTDGKTKIYTVDFEKGTEKLIHETYLTPDSMDLSDDGKTAFWIEYNDLYVLETGM